MKTVMVVGGGLCGAAAARCLADRGARVELWERAADAGGAARDYRHAAGMLVQAHGPHIFHTNSREAYDFLGRFTRWLPFAHRVRADIGGVLVPLPFNFVSLVACFSQKEADAYKAALTERFTEAEVGIDQLLASDSECLRRLGRFIFESVFRAYTEKQWGMPTKELGFAALRRVPIRLSERDGYFSDQFQAMPDRGYSAMIEGMLDHDNITVHCNCPSRLFSIRNDAFCLDGTPWRQPVIYTGCLAELFEYRYGQLPYRTLRFELFSASWPQQPVAVVNHPAAPGFTRTTEFGHFYPGTWKESVLMREYPLAWERDGPHLPYYPIPVASSAALYEQYQRSAAAIRGFFPAGRLGRYSYMNMDAAVLDGLRAADVAFALE